MTKVRGIEPSIRTEWACEYLDRYRVDSRLETKGLPRELRDLVSCIHEALFEPALNVKTAKSRCQIRDNNISSRFRFVIGKGIKEYIEEHRMAAATQLLRHDDLAVFEVAMMVGYEHVETFYQVFRRHFRCTPAAYRHRVLMTIGGGEVIKK
ncbi:MAG: helix-turn-helix transcriptional regulator [bacterium]|nr:helix-turn-helix transcriptional regulator [bacterium]